MTWWICGAIIVAAIIISTELSKVSLLLRDDRIKVFEEIKRLANTLELAQRNLAEFERSVEKEISAQRSEREAVESIRRLEEKERIRRGIADGSIRVYEG